MSDVQQCTETPCTIDVACNSLLDGASYAYYLTLSDDAFLKKDVAGETVWLAPPPKQLPEYLDHYLNCKTSEPYDTSACILVPARKGPWRTVMKSAGMRLLKQYPRGKALFATHSEGKQPVPVANSGMELWYDPPRPRLVVNAVARAKVTMQFSGTVANTPVIKSAA